MNIEAKEFVIKMSFGELWSIVFDVQSELQHTLEKHWVNHQAGWKESEKARLDILRNMFYALGRPDLYENIFPLAERIFKEFNQSRISKS